MADQWWMPGALLGYQRAKTGYSPDLYGPQGPVLPGQAQGSTFAGGEDWQTPYGATHPQRPPFTPRMPYAGANAALLGAEQNDPRGPNAAALLPPSETAGMDLGQGMMQRYAEQQALAQKLKLGEQEYYDQTNENKRRDENAQAMALAEMMHLKPAEATAQGARDVATTNANIKPVVQDEKNQGLTNVATIRATGQVGAPVPRMGASPVERAIMAYTTKYPQPPADQAEAERRLAYAFAAFNTPGSRGEPALLSDQEMAAFLANTGLQSFAHAGMQGPPR